MKILLLVDGSKWSHKAAMYAQNIALNRGAEVMLMSVLDREEAKRYAFNFCSQSGICDTLHQYEEQIWSDMKKGIEDDLSHLIKVFGEKGIDCEMKIVEGNAGDEINTEIENGGYSLVLTGAFGKSGRTHMGAVCEMVSRRSMVPHMIVK